MLTRWPGALDRSFGFSFFISLSSFVSRATLCASARLVVLKGFATNPGEGRILNSLSATFLSSLWLHCRPPFFSHPGIGLHVNMEGGGHLDARRCRGAGLFLAERGANCPEWEPDGRPPQLESLIFPSKTVEQRFYTAVNGGVANISIFLFCSMI